MAPAVDRCRKCRREPVGRREDAVPRHDRVLGRGRATRDPEPARPVALVHVATAREALVLRVLRDDRAGKRRRVLERGAHDSRRADAAPVVGEDPDTQRVELTHRRELDPLPRLRDRAGRLHVARGSRTRGEHRADHRRIVLRRRRVRHRDDRREAPEGGRARAGLDRLGVLHPGLPEMDVQVDEARRDDAAARVELAVTAQTGTDLGDPVVDDEHVRGPLAGLVHDPPTADHERVRQRALPTRAARTGRPSGWRRRSRPVR